MKQKQINISTLSDNVIALQPHRTRRNSQKSRGKSDNLSPAQREWLTRGLAQPGGKLPIFDRDGQKVNRKTINSCIKMGWASPWFDNPIKPDWLICKLTDEGRRQLDR